MKWISVKDRLPEIPNRYLVCFDDGIVDSFGFDNKKFYWDSECCRSQEPFDDDLMNTVTHWMPLPKPPLGD